MSQTEAPNLFNYDVFTMIALTFISIANIVYLSVATDFSVMGTPLLGASHTNLFGVFYYPFICYLVVDAIWIGAVSKRLSEDSFSFVSHYGSVFILCLIPLVYPQLEWVMAVNLLVLNRPLIRTIMCYLPHDSCMYRASDAFFTITLDLLQCVGLPVLFIYFLVDYQKQSTQDNTANIIFIGAFVLGVAAVFNFKWSYGMIGKASKEEEKPAEAPAVVAANV